MFIYNADTILTICKYLRLSDIDEFQLANKDISNILIKSKDYILREENHVLVQPHGLVVIKKNDIYKKGDKVWYKEGRVHRDGDLPAIIRVSGKQEWWQNNRQYRDNDLPTIISSSGNQIWRYFGVLHRDRDLPAVISINDNRE